MTHATRLSIDRSREFIDYSGSVFKHLTDANVRIANWKSRLPRAAFHIQEELRVPPTTPGLADLLTTFWQDLDALTCSPLVEETFGVDLTGVPDDAIRLIAFYALTTLLPGQRPGNPLMTPSILNTKILVALGLGLLQDGRRDEALEILAEAVKHVPVI